MPISLHYDTDRNVIFTKAEGEITIDDITAYFTAVAELKLNRGYCVLADYSNVILNLSIDDTYEMARRRKYIPPVADKIKIAVFCDKDYVFGVGRMYEALLGEDKYEVMIFRNQEEAESWLNL